MNSKQYNAKFDKLVDEFNTKFSANDIQKQFSDNLIENIENSKNITEVAAAIAGNTRFYNSEYSIELIRFMLKNFIVDDD